MKKTGKLKKILTDRQTYIVPGVYDCISARLAEKAGFKLVSVTGNGMVAAVLGLPDVGLMTMREVVDCSRNIASCISLPAIGDADTGYGSALNTVRTVREFELAGLAGIHLEDQASPKKCAYYAGKRELVSIGHQVHKLRAVVETRQDKDFCLIARTDALLPYGMKEAAKRARAYMEAGADAVFVVGFTGEKEIDDFKRTCRDVPLIVNINDNNPLNGLGLKGFADLGVKLAFYPATLRSAAARAIKDALACLAGGSTRPLLDGLMALDEFNQVLDVGFYQQLEEKYVRG